MLPASSSNEMHYSGPEREKLQHIIVKLGIREERIMLPRSRTTRAERNGSAFRTASRDQSACVTVIKRSQHALPNIPGRVE
jgi:hypothetical protein